MRAESVTLDFVCIFLINHIRSDVYHVDVDLQNKNDKITSIFAR